MKYSVMKYRNRKIHELLCQSSILFYCIWKPKTTFVQKLFYNYSFEMQYYQKNSKNTWEEGKRRHVNFVRQWHQWPWFPWWILQISMLCINKNCIIYSFIIFPLSNIKPYQDDEKDFKLYKQNKIRNFNSKLTLGAFANKKREF